jgi:hypothetical protein
VPFQVTPHIVLLYVSCCLHLFDKLGHPEAVPNDLTKRHCSSGWQGAGGIEGDEGIMGEWCILDSGVSER